MEERIHTIPLRREWLKTPKWKRAKKAVKTVRNYVKKHYRTESLRIGTALNEILWVRGSKNPPSKVKVTSIKKDDGSVVMELYGTKIVLEEEQKQILEKKQKDVNKKKLEQELGDKTDNKEEKKEIVEEALKEPKSLKKAKTEIKTTPKKIS